MSSEKAYGDGEFFDTSSQSPTPKSQFSVNYNEINKQEEQEHRTVKLNEPNNLPEDYFKVTVKFYIDIGTDKIMFTKAFKEVDSISDVKSQLAKLFSLTVKEIDLKKDDLSLLNSVRLVQLGIDAHRNLELVLETKTQCIINRQLIYGHIPIVDVINVRKCNGSELIVEIEYEDSMKKWLGGYRNKITKKMYHHASCQTDLKEQQGSKVSKGSQIYERKNQSTNTPISTKIQTSSDIEPNNKTRVFNLYNPKILELSNEKDEGKIVDSDHDREKKLSFKKFHGQCNEMSLKYMYNSIEKWQQHEKANLPIFARQSERKLRSIEILEYTRKLFMIADRERMKLYSRETKFRNQKLLARAATPKTFTSKTGKKVIVDTVETQQAKKLQVLYKHLNGKNTAIELIKIAVSELHEFFLLVNDFEFKNDILKLLVETKDILSKGIPFTYNLKLRIEQFIFQYVKHLMTSSMSKSSNEHLPVINIARYRDILIKLQNNEMKLFKCFTSVCFRMTIMEMVYLVSEIWKNASIKSSCDDLKLLIMQRWDTTQEWSPCNCILLTKQEAQQHMKCKLQDYDRLFASEVKNKHLQAKVHFCNTLLTSNQK